LFLENLKDRAIFQVPELIEAEAASNMVRAGFQDFAWTKQATNMLSAKGFRHGELLPYWMDSGKASLSFSGRAQLYRRELPRSSEELHSMIDCGRNSYAK